MGVLIAILQNITKWLIYKLYIKKIDSDIWVRLDQPFFNIDIKYRYHDCTSLNLDIVTERQLSYEDELKVFEIIGLVDDKYPMINIEAMLYTEEEYKQTYGEENS